MDLEQAKRSAQPLSATLGNLTVNRCLTLSRRALRAARLGFLFQGTSRTQFPRRVRLNGDRITLEAPEEYSISDVVNVWLDDEYGLSRVSPAPRTVVDVGANIGLFSLWAVHHFPEAVIHAYEPNAQILPYCRSNLSSTNVQLFSTGVARQAGTAALVDRGDVRTVLLRPTGDAKDGIRLESFAVVVERAGGRIDLLKMDCEGGEWDILEDRDSMQQVDQIRMEYHLDSRRSLEDFEALAASAGFSITHLSKNRDFGIAWLRNGQLASA